ncbi:hypothetical protein ACFP3J_34420, partial [Streptomyces nogalater]
PAPRAAGAEAEAASAARGTRRNPADAARTGVGREPLRPGTPAPTVLGTPATPATLPTPTTLPTPADALRLAAVHAPYGSRGAGGAPARPAASACLAAARETTGPGPGRTPVRPEHPAGTV